MNTVERLEEEILELPVSDRARLAKRLLESLDQPQVNEEAATIEQAWAEEIQQRLSAYRDGKLRAVAGPKVLRNLRDRLSR